MGTGKRGVDFTWYSPEAFAERRVAQAGTNCSPDQYGFLPFADGNSGRNILDGPGMQNIDLSMLKNWVLNEGGARKYSSVGKCSTSSITLTFNCPIVTSMRLLPVISARRKRVAAAGHESCSSPCVTISEPNELITPTIAAAAQPGRPQKTMVYPTAHTWLHCGFVFINILSAVRGTRQFPSLRGGELCLLVAYDRVASRYC